MGFSPQPPQGGTHSAAAHPFTFYNTVKMPPHRTSLNSTASRFAGTLNNPDPAEIENIKGFMTTKATYGVIGFEHWRSQEETGEIPGGYVGTPHLQMYFEMPSKVKLGTMVRRAEFQHAHLESAVASGTANTAYCRKEWDTRQAALARGEEVEPMDPSLEPFVVGEIREDRQGHRTDHDELREFLDSCTTWKQVIRNGPPSLARNLTYAKQYFNQKAPKVIPFAPRTGFQKDIMDMIQEDAPARKIVWIYDPVGGMGKSTLCNALIRNHDAFYCAGKGADIFYAYDNERIVLIDVPRSTTEEYISYGAIEKLKDGLIFSPKYESGMKIRDGEAHVIVFANCKPAEGKWTSDRLDLRQISSEDDDEMWTNIHGAGDF